MEAYWTILLDLDQTLVLTSALARLRQQRNWQHVYTSFHLTTLPPGTQTFVQQARRLAPSTRTSDYPAATESSRSKKSYRCSQGKKSDEDQRGGC